MSRRAVKELTDPARAPSRRSPASPAEEGMLTLREDGMAKVRAGVTSLEEVLRVTA